MVEIYGKKNCGACTQAEVLCKSNTLVYRTYKVEEDYSIIELFEKIGQDVRSFPQIFVDGNHVGGLKEFQETL